MNNMQLYLSIGIPTLTVILAWLSSRSDINRLNDKVDKQVDALRSDLRGELRELRGEMSRRFDAVDHRFDAIDAELRYFHGFTGKLDGRVEALEKRK